LEQLWRFQANADALRWHQAENLPGRRPSSASTVSVRNPTVSAEPFALPVEVAGEETADVPGGSRDQYHRGSSRSIAG
jgi:hypothetical protein